MFDFSEIKLVKDPNDNFVGIRKSTTDDSHEFWLPNGFHEFPEGDFDKIRDFFFRMYRTFRKFENDNKPSKLNLNRPDYQRDQDQTTVSSGGLSLTTEDGETCQLYSKLRMIERIIETYDEFAINSIKKKVKRTSYIDYSQMSKYLDRAIYLQNDMIYVETMDLPRLILRYESTDIVDLYCYILDEIIQQLQEDVPDYIKDRRQDISFLAQQFKDHCLTSEQSIFHQDTFLETINILKETLDNIDKYTYYKDADYWGFYEAIETFLYGEINPEFDDGEYWGIKGFSLIWEDMCNTYFFRNHNKEICFADTDIRLKDHVNSSRKNDSKDRVGNLYLRPKWIYSTESDCADDDCEILKWYELLVLELDLDSRYLVLTNLSNRIIIHPNYGHYDDFKYAYINDNQEKSNKLKPRFFRPDLVLKDNDFKLEIIDYKDVPIKLYLNPSSPRDRNKCKNDIVKQLTYELALQKTHTIRKNKFFIPYYYQSKPTQNPLGKIEATLENGIVIFQANFFLIQEEYLKENT